MGRGKTVGAKQKAGGSHITEAVGTRMTWGIWNSCATQVLRSKTGQPGWKAGLGIDSGWRLQTEFWVTLEALGSNGEFWSWEVTHSEPGFGMVA